MSDPQATVTEPTPDRPALEDALAQVSVALDRQDPDEVRETIEELHPGEVALLLESLPQEHRDAVWEQVHPAQRFEVFAEADDAVRAEKLLTMPPEEVAAIAGALDADDAADLLQDLPEPVVDEVLRAMDAQDRARLEAVLVFDEDTAGGLMNLDVITARADVTLETVARYLRRRGDIPEKTNRLFVVDRDNHYLGSLRLADLLTGDPDKLVAALMRDDLAGIPATTPAREVALVFEQQNLITAPVVDAESRLLGRITVDDVVDVIRDESEHSIMGMAGLDEEDDMFAPVLATSRTRAVWLGINLATALLAAWVIGLFEATIQEVVALAVLMPVVASMGGIAGSQSLTVVVRAMALGQLHGGNVAWMVRRESLVGMLNSLIWALVTAAIAWFWFESTLLGAIVAVALVVNVGVAALSGALLPLAMRRLGIDPAVAGGVVLTTITDVVGFVTFLGLGSLLLLS